MATLSIRIEDEVRHQLEQRADGEGVSVSELIRQAIDALLARDTQLTLNWSAPTSLSRRDRLQLSLLHRIVQAIAEEEGEAEYHARMVEVLQNGFAGEYGDEFIAISDELTLDQCKLLWEILDMFRILKSSVEKIGIQNIPGVQESEVSFGGFDFNDSLEVGLALYAQHLVENGKWQELAHHFDAEHEFGNSHIPMLAVYRRMLAVYQPIWDGIITGASRSRSGFNLTAEEVSQIVEARQYPR